MQGKPGCHGLGHRGQDRKQPLLGALAGDQQGAAAEREQLANSFATNKTEIEALRDLLRSLDKLYLTAQEKP